MNAENPSPEGFAQATIMTSAPRRVMLLQGIMGPFFRRLGMALREAGHSVFKVNFNGGDRAFWRLPNGIDYRGTLEEWGASFAGLIKQHGITDIMLFGDCRDHHTIALDLCRQQGVTAYVFEEGYIRPDWVTMEIGGVNGYSTLSRDPQWYRTLASQLPPIPDHQKVSSSFRRRATEGFAYNAADVLTRWRYPGWQTHRPWHPVVEGMGWARKLNRRKQRESEAAALIERLIADRERYFLFPLQLDSDAQIRLHSPFVGIADALRQVLESFAHNAPRDVRLVIKEHPLDNGVRDWEMDARDIAQRLGVAERIDYLAAGDIEEISRHSLGMVTINSTSGTLALAQGIPVVVLGTAIYNMPDLTNQAGLDRFWTDPVNPDPATFAAFRRVLIDRCLIPGGFFSEEALSKVVRHAVARFEGRFLMPD
ncbi:MAG: capsular biosynthesis protein [Porphyrobacter sp.]|jgi:capsular polysaccharide export protein|nr:capsular biosynthesis protein [Porphyrobacter sp.]